MLDECYSGDVCVLLGFFVGFLATAADGMALPVVLRWYTGNQMRFGSRRPCERFPICLWMLCLVELPVKVVCRRSQVRFLLTGFPKGVS